MLDKIVGTVVIVLLICIWIWMIWELIQIILILGVFFLLGALVAWYKHGKDKPNE